MKNKKTSFPTEGIKSSHLRDIGFHVKTLLHYVRSFLIKNKEKEKASKRVCVKGTTSGNEHVFSWREE